MVLIAWNAERGVSPSIRWASDQDRMVDGEPVSCIMKYLKHRREA
jgi:hypothetical protein